MKGAFAAVELGGLDHAHAELPAPRRLEWLIVAAKVELAPAEQLPERVKSG